MLEQHSDYHQGFYDAQSGDVPWWIAADTLEAALAEINRLREKIAILEAIERSRD